MFPLVHLTFVLQLGLSVDLAPTWVPSSFSLATFDPSFFEVEAPIYMMDSNDVFPEPQFDDIYKDDENGTVEELFTTEQL